MTSPLILDLRASRVLIEEYIPDKEMEKYAELVKWKHVKFFSGANESPFLSIVVRTDIDEGKTITPKIEVIIRSETQVCGLPGASEE